MFMVPPPMVVVADELPFEFNVTLPKRMLFAMLNVADEFDASIVFVTSVPFTIELPETVVFLLNVQLPV